MEYNSSTTARAAYVSNSSVTATGGTITEVDGYRIHTFTTNGTFTIDIATNVEVLVVAGGGAAKPKFTLYNKGINNSAQMTGGADNWEKLTVSGTPSGKGVVFLKVEGFSTEVDAKYFVDDIQISQ
ncbi:MAG: hypothetical protein U9O97_05955 [Elusimicrobiota bacterium]|nr:hypothetical protein [Elusimicrobiota bacterium]